MENQEVEVPSNFLGKGNEMNEDIRIFLVDGHELVRHGLRHMLEAEEDMMVLGDCADAEEALIETIRLHQNITLIGTHMPGMNAIEATRRLKRDRLNHGNEVIILGESADYQAEAFEAGAASYLLKDITRVKLIQTIRQVYQNRYPPKESAGSAEELVDLVIPPPANAACLMRFMYQLAEIFHDDSNDSASIIRMVIGSWDRGTVITTQPQPMAFSSFLIELANMPEVEKVEETGEDSFQKHNQRMKAFRLSHSKKTMRVTLNETGMARQELSLVN